MCSCLQLTTRTPVVPVREKVRLSGLHTLVLRCLFKTDFDTLVQVEGIHQNNQVCVDVDLNRELLTTARRQAPISSEEQVTAFTSNVLGVFSDKEYGLTGDIFFPARNAEIIAFPDLVAMERDDEGLAVGSARQSMSPPMGKKAKTRRDNLQLVRSLYRFPFETKPHWKFKFMDSLQAHIQIINEFEIPEDFHADNMLAETALPLGWSGTKKKIFHVVRQLYGQMVTDHCQYGVLHIYERWFFCKRNSEGTFSISRSFARTDTSPSVFQAIKTMTGFEDFSMMTGAVHPSSASKAFPAPKQKKSRGKKNNLLPPTYQGASDGGWGDQKPSERQGKSNTSAKGRNLALDLYPSDCQVFDATSSILLLTSCKYPFVLLKLQKNPQARHIEEHLSNEASMYAALEGNAAVQEVIPRFYGHSTHLGVAMSCLEKEGDDLEDIGLEQVSAALKLSAVYAVRVLSEAGVLHNDLALRNIVQSKDDPDQAKVIDFGRSVFSSDQKSLADQVEWAKTLLEMK
mmetsp:Transcript_13926/g.16095  ORF Transcript_13926/g.16095 Transcript_13926/m.16095 type:complete len:514 (-) Transcript_13926:343-1884(-)